LLTFGCSWTYGVGAGYESGMSKHEYSQIAWDPNICNKLSWRGLVSDKYDVFNRNFAAGGSSNQKQERLAMQYVTSVNFQDDQNTFDKIILLWGITSTARNEMFSLQKNKPDNIHLNDKTELSKSLLKFSYNHDFEVWLLAQKMRFWNLLFSGLNIKNLWFDTFNHHDYPVKLENHIDFGTGYSDLMSNMYLKTMPGVTPIQKFQMHLSAWRADEERSKYLSYLHYLNRSTLHPTVKGHRLIADLLIPELDKHI
jgi:hypothetical protein